LALDCVEAFAELLYILMQGAGVGFSVEREYTNQLPRVRQPIIGAAIDRFEVPDDTEGWCDALKFGLVRWLDGYDAEFDVRGVRPKGARLRTKGGVASGPEPLLAMLSAARGIVRGRAGMRLRPIDCHDIACHEGEIVHMGGVRRSSGISLSDLDDRLMRDAKAGAFFDSKPFRGMANNSAVYEEKPSFEAFLEEWRALVRSRSGERGIFNRQGALAQMPERRRRVDGMGTNPCGEILLRNGQTCNLSIAIARAWDTPETLERKVRLAAILGTVQSRMTDFHYVRPMWRANAEEERLLGVDVNGQMDCPWLRPGAPGREALLRRLRQVAVDTNAAYASRFGINQSAAVTCVKPGGNSSELFNCSSGIHPRFAPYQIRRFRLGAHTPVAKLLLDSGVPCHPEVGQTWETAAVLVFEFPKRAPEGALMRGQLTAVAQLENWLAWKLHYTEHNPSQTIVVGDDEWLEVAAWVFQHWDQVGGLAFLPRDNGVYRLAPNEEVSREDYERLLARLPEVDFSKLMRYEVTDQTVVAHEAACTSGACDV
jgi:ribonucleoside-diphosphate reductase alpha chain